MAIINGLYIHVVDEDLARDIESTSHPVEKGIDLTDTVHAKANVISLSGKIVDYDNIRSSEVVLTLTGWAKKGSLVNYSGRNVLKSMQIKSFNTSYSNENNGGADFDMTLQEVRIAKSSYTPKPVVKPSKNNPVLKVGATVVFKGGGVYVSSDARQIASTRGRSTCKITIISTAPWSKHDYHLISSDGKGVWGWVDKANIEGAATNKANAKTNAGTQQTRKR